MNCVLSAWDLYERELRAWLSRRLDDPHEAEDVLQDLFVKALRQGTKFCDVADARAWLYEVARNTVVDRLRVRKEQVALPDDLVAEQEEMPAVESLAACLPRVLASLSAQDREAIMRCDMEGMRQEDYARLRGLSLSAAKSRVQRARKRLRAKLTEVCQVRFDAAGKVCCFVACPAES